MMEVIYASATTLVQAIRTKKVSSEEVVKAYLQRIETVNPHLNAVVQVLADTSITQARAADAALARGENLGPLHGVPVTIKDSLETQGVVCTGGTKGRAHYVSTQDATVVARLRAAGAIILGKTNLPELSVGMESDNLVYGRTNNPYDLLRIPGGSSGGEAAIIAAGGSPFGIGADAGGSIRLPCHFCGIAGIKPTTNRVPRTGHFPPLGGLLAVLWQFGPMARFVEDLILVLPIISGVDWRDPAIVPMSLGDPTSVNFPNLRVAFHTDNGIMSPTPATVAVIEKIAHLLAESGMIVEEARPAGIEQSNELIISLFGMDGGAGLERVLQKAGTREIHPVLKQRLESLRPAALSMAELSSLMERWDHFCSTMLRFMEHYDVILCPVAAYPAPPHGITLTDGRLLAASYTRTYNLTGWPSTVVRAGTSPEGLPIGIQVIAHPWCEEVALAVAQHIETVAGGWQRPLL